MQSVAETITAAAARMKVVLGVARGACFGEAALATQTKGLRPLQRVIRGRLAIGRIADRCDMMEERLDHR